MSLLKQLDLIKALELQTRLKAENGLAYYVPHKKQALFHSLGEYKFRYLRTGNRFGKSDCGAAEDCAFALGERMWLPKTDPLRFAGIPKHSVKLLLVCTDWKKADEIFTNQAEGTSQGKLFKFLPKDSIVDVEKDHGGHISKLTIKCIWGGYSTITLDTVAAFQQNPQKAESSDWDAIHVDEPIPRDMWVGVSRGLQDRNGKAWFTCTPLTEPWINDLFHATKRDKLKQDEPNIYGHYVTLLGRSSDNPYTNAEGREIFNASLTAAELAARSEGIPLEQTGMVYDVFSDETHVFSTPPPGWADVNHPPKNYTIRFALDPHPSTPHAMLFAATSPEGRVYFFNEIFDPCDAEQLAKQFHEMTEGYFVIGGIADPSAYILAPNTKRSMADDLMDFGVFFEKGPKDPARGILAVRTALARPGYLNFAHNLKETLYEMDRYVWDPKRPNRARDKDDHMMENLYRLVLTDLSYIQQEDEATYSRPISFIQC